MKKRDYVDYALQMPGAYEDYPFGEDPLCIKVQGKLFAVFYADPARLGLTLKCRPDLGDFYKQVYPNDITPGYHFPKAMKPYWLSIRLGAGVPENEICSLITNSYNEVVAKLPRAARAELGL